MPNRKLAIWCAKLLKWILVELQDSWQVTKPWDSKVNEAKVGESVEEPRTKLKTEVSLFVVSKVDRQESCRYLQARRDKNPQETQINNRKRLCIQKDLIISKIIPINKNLRDPLAERILDKLSVTPTPSSFSLTCLKA